MYKLFERAKPDDADLLSEIQRIDPAILVARDADDKTLSVLAHNVVNWLQVSPVFPPPKTIQSNFTTTLQPVLRNAAIHHTEPYHFGTVMFVNMTLTRVIPRTEMTRMMPPTEMTRVVPREATRVVPRAEMTRTLDDTYHSPLMQRQSIKGK